MMKWYLAGPMTGYPQFNFPLFMAVTRSLREQGLEIVSPVELDDEKIRNESLASPNGEAGTTSSTWGECLGRDVRVVADIAQGVLLLPGWPRSRGAILEAVTAVLCNHKLGFVQWDEVQKKATVETGPHIYDLVLEYIWDEIGQ